MSSNLVRTRPRTLFDKEITILQDKVNNWLKPRVGVVELGYFYQGIGIFCLNFGINAFNTFYSQTVGIRKDL